MGMIVIQPYILVSKLKKIKTKFLRCTGYLNSKKPYIGRFIAKKKMSMIRKYHNHKLQTPLFLNSSSCTTTELSKVLTSCLTAVKKHVIKYCEKVYERSGKTYFGLLKIQVKF